MSKEKRENELELYSIIQDKIKKLLRLGTPMNNKFQNYNHIKNLNITKIKELNNNEK